MVFIASAAKGMNWAVPAKNPLKLPNMLNVFTGVGVPPPPAYCHCTPVLVAVSICPGNPLVAGKV